MFIAVDFLEFSMVNLPRKLMADWGFIFNSC